MNILVTGGAGFIGSHLVERLLGRGDEVTIVDSFSSNYDPAIKRNNIAAHRGRVNLVQADIRDVDRLRDVFTGNHFDAVAHLAAEVGVRPSITQPSLYTSVNIAGTQNLLELAVEFNVKKFVFASSSSVYGVNSRGAFREDDPVSRPISPYAATKLAGEALGHVYHHLHDLDVVCLRFFTVYGPRQRPDLAIHKFVRAILRDTLIEVYGDGSALRDFTYVDDIVAGICAALERGFGYEIFNLGEARTVSLIELLRLIEQATGSKARIQFGKPQPGDVPVTHADISKARRLLDYQPTTPIEDGILRFVDWFRSSNPSPESRPQLMGQP